MAAGRYDTDIEQGETFIRVFTWKDSTGTAVNVTGYTARMQLRRDATSATAEHSFTSSDSIALGGSAGTVTLTIAATTTANMTSRYYYDLELISGSSVVYKLLKGIFTVQPEITR